MAGVSVTPYLADPDVTLYHGGAATVIAELTEASVDCVVTSPPYFGLRDYGWDGQIGLEESPAAFVAALVEVFRQVRRVLAPHGTCWVNMGDSYAANRTYQVTDSKHINVGNTRGSSVPDGYKPKDLLGIPWRLAFALQADGWWLRSDVIWAKPNPMPESVTDRPTKAHEYLFLLTKANRYFWDAEGVREPDGGKPSGNGFVREHRLSYGSRGQDDQWTPGGGRNVRSVWTFATEPNPEAHFATFPRELVRRCLSAGCPERVCATCGEPSRRETAVEYVKSPVHGAGSVVGRHYETGANGYDGAGMPRLSKQVTTTGWTDCGHDAYRPGIVLDPFIGSGTTAVVARAMGRRCVGIDGSAEYLEIARRRTQQLSLLGGEAA
jgi:DNA modification methylase